MGYLYLYLYLLSTLVNFSDMTADVCMYDADDMKRYTFAVYLYQRQTGPVFAGGCSYNNVLPPKT